jgi:dUTP pyrophosphatase
MRLSNAVGIIDSKYRGEVKFFFENGGMDHIREFAYCAKALNIYEVGDRIGQIIIMPYPKIEFEEVNELSDTERGNSGFGSSGA